MHTSNILHSLTYLFTVELLIFFIVHSPFSFLPFGVLRTTFLVPFQLFPILLPLSPCRSLNISRKEVISLLSDDSSNNHGNDANNEMDVNVEIPPNAPILETIANIPAANYPITF
jgi:hypothetical protein